MSRRFKEYRVGDVVVCWGSQKKKAVSKYADEVLYLEWFDSDGDLHRGTASVRKIANHYITLVCTCGHRVGDHAEGPCERCSCRRYREEG